MYQYKYKYKYKYKYFSVITIKKAQHILSKHDILLKKERNGVDSMCCGHCGGKKMAIKKTLQLQDKIIYNVPVYECADCADITYSLNTGLMIENYIKHHDTDKEIDFKKEIQPFYEGMSTEEILTIQNIGIQ